MSYNSRLDSLHPYPFAKLSQLLAGVVADDGKKKISLAIGEPQHVPPEITLQVLKDSLHSITRYPSTAGEPALRQSICDWLTKRYSLSDGLVTQENILPALGTREALFAVAQTLVNVTGHEDVSNKPLVLMPSPFYQIYEGAAIMAGATPYYLPATQADEFKPDFSLVPESVWQRCQLFYICNPSNPTGAVLTISEYQFLLEQARKYDFVICSDECYSEIYLDEQAPVLGLLDAIESLSSNSLKQQSLQQALVFNSLSKRSNLAGMRSGFVAGGSKLIERFLLYRTYHGSAMPLYHQQASRVSWADELHVQENRALYREKIIEACQLINSHKRLSVTVPEGGFCLWVAVSGCDQAFTKALYRQQNVVVLPGSYLARDIDGRNAGAGFVRIALVQQKEQCLEAIARICKFADIL